MTNHIHLLATPAYEDSISKTFNPPGGSTSVLQFHLQINGVRHHLIFRFAIPLHQPNSSHGPFAVLRRILRCTFGSATIGLESAVARVKTAIPRRFADR